MEYATFGIILHKLNLELDELFLLMFPLQAIEDSLRKTIVKGIGTFSMKVMFQL